MSGRVLLRMAAMGASCWAPTGTLLSIALWGNLSGSLCSLVCLPKAKEALRCSSAPQGHLDVLGAVLRCGPLAFSSH